MIQILIGMTVAIAGVAMLLERSWAGRSRTAHGTTPGCPFTSVTLTLDQAAMEMAAAMVVATDDKLRAPTSSRGMDR